jgi:hypothetical protein
MIGQKIGVVYPQCGNSLACRGDEWQCTDFESFLSLKISIYGFYKNLFPFWSLAMNRILHLVIHRKMG